MVSGLRTSVELRTIIFVQFPNDCDCYCSRCASKTMMSSSSMSLVRRSGGCGYSADRMRIQEGPLFNFSFCISVVTSRIQNQIFKFQHFGGRNPTFLLVGFVNLYTCLIYRCTNCPRQFLCIATVMDLPTWVQSGGSMRRKGRIVLSIKAGTYSDNKEIKEAFIGVSVWYRLHIPLERVT